MLSTLPTSNHDSKNHAPLHFNTRQPSIDPNLENRLCPGCKESAVTEDGGLVVAFGSSFFHVDCFKCAKCGDHVTADTNLLLLSDGSPICANCSYSCNVCHLPILDEAIMTGDDSYHAHCFKCKVCKNRIDELVFAKTSQGIYCMNCHNDRMAKIRRHAQKKAEREKLEKERTAIRNNMVSPARGPHSPTNSTTLKTSPPSQDAYLKSPSGSQFPRAPSKRKSIPYVADAFASDTHNSSSSRVHSPVSPRSPHHRVPSPVRSLSVNVAPPPGEPALNSAPLMGPSNFGGPIAYPYSEIANTPQSDMHTSRNGKNTLPIPPEESDGLCRRKSYDDGTRPLSQLFKQTGSPISRKGSPVATSSTEALSVPTSRSAKRHSINPGSTFNVEKSLFPSSGKSSPTSPLVITSSSGLPHTPNGRDSPQVSSPLRQEFLEDTPSRPLSHASSSTVFRSSRSSPVSSDNYPSRGPSVSRSRSVSRAASPSTQPTANNEGTTSDRQARIANDASPVNRGVDSANDDRSPKISSNALPSGDVSRLRGSSEDLRREGGESHSSGRTLDVSRGIKASPSRSRTNSPIRHADVPHNVEGWTDSEAESDNGAKSVEKRQPPLAPPKERNDNVSPIEPGTPSDDIDPDVTRGDMADLTDLSEGSHVEDRMSHATFIAPALPPIRFSMTGSDFSELLSGVDEASRDPWDYLSNYMEEEPDTPPTAFTTSSGETMIGKSPVQISPDDDRTAPWKREIQGNGVKPDKSPDISVNGYPRTLTSISESAPNLSRGRSSSESNAPSASFSSTKYDESSSQNSHSSIGSLPGNNTRPPLTRQDSTTLRKLKQDKFQLVKRRLEEALADANERGAYQLKLDRAFVEAIVSSMEQGNQNYSLLKGKLDGVKRESRQYIDGLTVAQTEYDQELKSRRDAEAEVTRLRILLAGQAARLTALSGEHRQLQFRQEMSKDLADNVQRLEQEFSKLKLDRDVTLAEVEELVSMKSPSNAISGTDASTGQPGRSLSVRLDNVKTQYVNDILPLAQQREALAREVAELKAVRDVFLEETTVLNARNEELAQLSTLYTRRVESSTQEQSPLLTTVPGRVASLDKSRQVPSTSQSFSSATTAAPVSDEGDAKFAKPHKSEPHAELSTPQHKGKFMKWPGSKAKDFVSSAMSSMAIPEFVKGKPFLEHTFQQLSVLRFTRCTQCGDKMFGSQLRCSSCHISVHVRCINNVVTTCTHQSPSSRDDSQLSSLLPSMFGRDLVEQVRADRRDGERMVPIIVEKCIEAVEALAMDHEGIYRKTGGSGQSKQITQLFEYGDYNAFDLHDTNRFNDICAVTSVLKTYFRSLPVPLLTYDLHDKFIAAAEIREPSMKSQALTELVTQMPSEHYYTLRTLMLHLHRVQEQSATNLMNARNLGVVFGPTLMRSPDPAAEFSDMAGKALSIEWLVANASTVFLK